MGNLTWQHTSCVVPSNFCSPSTMWSSTIVLILNQEVRWNQTTFKVVTDRHCKDGKDILICRFYTNNISNTDQKRTKVKGSSCTIWWNILFICFYDCLTSIHKHICWNLRHQQPISRALQTFGVLIWTEQLDASIFCTVGFQPFKGLLTVMQTWRGFGQMQGRIFCQFSFFPSSIAIMCQIAIR